MGLRFRRSIRLGKFARLNFSKSGMSLGLGPRGLNVNIGSRGTRTTVGIPGTGLYWQKTKSWESSSSENSAPSSIPNPSNPRSASRLWQLPLGLIGAVFVISLLSNMHSSPTPPIASQHDIGPASSTSSTEPARALSDQSITTPHKSISAATVPAINKATQAQITELQRDLNRLGYNTGNPDGRFGPKTRAALRAYARAKGLDVPSTITPELLSRLKAEPSSVSASHTE